MTYDYVLKKVQVIASDQLGVDVAECGADLVLGDDLGADSMDLVSIVLDVEAELGCEISEDETEAVRTLGDIARVASKALQIEVPA